MTLTPASLSTPVSQSTELQARLDDPEIAGALGVLLDHADLLALVVVALDGFIARSEVIGDSLIDGVTELRAVVGSGDSGIDMAALLDAGKVLGAAAPALTPALTTLVESGLLDQMGGLADSLARATASFETAPVEVGGIFSVARLLKDPDINRTVSFAATLAKSFGRDLAAPTPSSARSTQS